MTLDRYVLLHGWPVSGLGIDTFMTALSQFPTMYRMQDRLVDAEREREMTRIEGGDV